MQESKNPDQLQYFSEMARLAYLGTNSNTDLLKLAIGHFLAVIWGQALPLECHQAQKLWQLIFAQIWWNVPLGSHACQHHTSY